MNYINLTVLIILIFCLLVGFLIGFLRKTVKSTIRFVLVLISLLLAVFLNKQAMKTLYMVDIGGKDFVTFLSDKIQTVLNIESQAIKPMIATFLGIFGFIILFILIRLLTLLLYGVITSIMSPDGDKNTKAEKKKSSISRIIGGAIGLVQGFIIAFVYANCITGLSNQMAKIEQIKIDDKSIMTASEDISFVNYSDGTLAKVFKNPEFLFDKVTTVTFEGDTYHLKYQINGVVALADVANEVIKLENVDYETSITTSKAKEISNILKEINKIIEQLNAEEKACLTDTSKSLALFITLPIDLKYYNLASIDYEQEAQLIMDVTSCTYTNVTEATSVLNSLVDSDLILNLAIDLGITVQLSSLEKVSVNTIISSSNYSSDQIQKLNTVFQLS